jgi:hypothetical protein
MSLKLTNRCTDKQKEMLKKLGYLGSYDITVSEAAECIDGLLEEKRLADKDEEQYEGWDNFNYIRGEM